MWNFHGNESEDEQDIAQREQFIASELQLLCDESRDEALLDDQYKFI